MSEEQPCATPLVERLRAIPKDAHLTYEHSAFSHSMFPVGLMAHEAADALTAMRKAAPVDDERTALIARIDAKIAQQRQKGGDMMTFGEADPLLVECRAALQ